jgi:hypothetical protein
MLSLYADESLHEPTGMYVVGGFIGHEKQWKAFCTRWRSQLAPRSSLHMASLRLGTTNAPKRYGDLLARLGKLPSECGLVSIAGSVCRNDYLPRVSGTALEILMEGYVLAAIALLDELGARLQTGERVKVFFEEQHAHAEQLRRAMQFWKTRHRVPSGWSVVAEWGALRKGTRLEPADYLCYALQQERIDPTSQKAILTAPILAATCIRNHNSAANLNGWLDYISARRVRPVPYLTQEVRRVIQKPQI